MSRLRPSPGDIKNTSFLKLDLFAYSDERAEFYLVWFDAFIFLFIL
jgi:hypothetical protein